MEESFLSCEGLNDQCPICPNNALVSWIRCVASKGQPEQTVPLEKKWLCMDLRGNVEYHTGKRIRLNPFPIVIFSTYGGRNDG